MHRFKQNMMRLRRSSMIPRPRSMARRLVRLRTRRRSVQPSIWQYSVGSLRVSLPVFYTIASTILSYRIGWHSSEAVVLFQSLPQLSCSYLLSSLVMFGRSSSKVSTVPVNGWSVLAQEALLCLDSLTVS